MFEFKFFDFNTAMKLEEVRKELIRFNDNFDRLLTHIGVPIPGEDAGAVKSLYVGEPLSEAEQAVREYAAENGLELNTDDEKRPL